ncbi:OsmC family protein [Bordetella genomosp. 12]|uniref:Osmotically inducible protein OsmC n=1 Tax=Bordetella genomosp. 12 TaxID=463035 RepID=A0A261VL64_9BORD|nr:OsmC family protein [Bordetella genomosp. 12]OZI74874.1 hypothetical protein CAL22_10595 [Bordetella genomosp. 12]
MPTLRSTTIGLQGRYLLSARDQHLVADATPSRGGPGQAWLAAELLLAALATCAQAVIESSAREQAVVLRCVRVHGEAEADEARPGHYAFVRLDFELEGATQEEARALVGVYLNICPIYGSVSRGAPVTVNIRGLA